MTVEDLMRRAAGGELMDGSLQEFALEAHTTFAEAVDTMALALAEQFLAGALDFATADRIANAMWTAMVDEARRVSDDAVPDFAHAVFDAIDQGEYDHGDSLDAVETITVPRLRELVATTRPHT